MTDFSSYFHSLYHLIFLTKVETRTYPSTKYKSYAEVAVWNIFESNQSFSQSIVLLLLFSLLSLLFKHPFHRRPITADVIINNARIITVTYIMLLFLFSPPILQVLKSVKKSENNTSCRISLRHHVKRKP